MMVANPDWTAGLGWATAHQLPDVTSAVQRFRFQAKTAGNLKSDSHVKVIEEGTTIRIEPANPQVIYVPTYQTQAVLVSHPPTYGTVLFYSAAIATNILLWQNVFHGPTSGLPVGRPSSIEPSISNTTTFRSTSGLRRTAAEIVLPETSVDVRPQGTSRFPRQAIGCHPRLVHRCPIGAPGPGWAERGEAWVTIPVLLRQRGKATGARPVAKVSARAAEGDRIRGYRANVKGSVANPLEIFTERGTHNEDGSISVPGGDCGGHLVADSSGGSKS